MQVQPQPQPPPEPEPEPEPKMSEGRMLTSLYNKGFRWGISPGLVLSDKKTSFYIGASVGYGFDTGPLIFIPGVRLAAYFTDPNVYVGMPTMRIVIPIDRFAPFVQGGAGIGHVEDPAKSGLALMGGGGFMVYFRHFALGAEASYQVITNTNFKGVGFGPIIAFGF